MTPEERSLRARIASNARWSRVTDAEAKASGERAQRGLTDRFQNQVDPERTLPQAERERRGAAAKREHMARMALKSAQVRKAKAAARAAGMAGGGSGGDTRAPAA